ncbi:MAG: FN3 associated domain-containing protein [Victivallales bacterium]
MQVQFLPESRKWERMDIYVPKTEAPQYEGLPCVMLIYGGGWRGKAMFNRENIQILLDNGYVVAVPDYVLSAQQPVPITVWDVAASVRFLRANAQKYSIDPGRIGAMGSSAGGILLQHLCTSDSRTVVRLEQHAQAPGAVPVQEPHPANELFSAKLSALVIDWGAYQMERLNSLSPDDPPLFTVHNDKMGTWSAGARAYADSGATVELAYINVKDTHAVVGVHVPNITVNDKSGRECSLGERTLQFLDEYVKNPAVATAPEILPHGGSIPGTTPVILRSVHDLAEIHYTTDGSEPDAASPAYMPPLKINPGQTLRAIAIRPGLKPSPVVSATFIRCKENWPIITTTQSAFEVEAGQQFSAVFEAQSPKPVTWRIDGKVCPVSDTGSPPLPMPVLKIDSTSGKLTGMSPSPGTAVFIVSASFKDGGEILYDARSVTVTVK